MSGIQDGGFNLPDFMVITDLGGEQHAIDRRSIVTMTNSIPSNPPEGFVFGKDIITITVATPAGLIGYHTRETLISLIKRVGKTSSIKEYTYQRGKEE